VKSLKALLSVSDKRGLDKLGHMLSNNGYDLYATSGTAKYLASNGISVHPLEEITGFSELAEGRVKTLNEKIFEMVLSKKEGFDIVVVNLYPFKEAINKGIDAMVENFDIGGVALLRASAKNYDRVAVLSSPELYEWFYENIPLNNEKRKFLAMKAMEVIIKYDSMILHDLFNYHFSATIDDLKPLKYGENPHQHAWVGKLTGMPSLLDNVKLIKGELSYNNYLDLIVATQIVSDCGEGTMAIIKHTNACGVAKFRNDSLSTFQRALDGDPQSAYGGILCINDIVDGELAKVIKPHFFDLIIARKLLPEAINMFKQKKANLIEFEEFKDASMEWKISNGVVLVQEPDIGDAYEYMTVLTKREPTDEEIEDAKFGLKVVRYIKSNAIVLVKDGTLIGMGSGQPSRVDSASIAIEKSRKYGHSLEGSVMISDGFFPFADSIEMGIKNGIRCFVEPGGSKRDEEMIKLCDENDAVLIFTGKRLFKH